MKLIRELNEEEFEDLMFLNTDINAEITGLDYNIFIMPKSYLDNKTPYIYVFNKDIRYITTNEEYAIIKLSSNPYIIYDELQIDFNDVFNFIKKHKKLFMKYWNWKVGTPDIYDELLRNKIKD